MHRVRFNLLLCAWMLLLCPAAPAVAQTTKPADPPTAKASAEETPEEIAAQYLGERFTSRAAGISFRPPLRATAIKPTLAGTNIVQYVNTEEKWALRLTHMVLEKPKPLVAVDDPATPRVDEAKENPGVLDEIVKQVATQAEGTRILRRDTTTVGPNPAGMLIVRFAQPNQMSLRQLAIIQRDQRDYYLFDLTTPSTHAPNDPDDVEDPSEAMAVKIFQAILDSTQLLNMRPVLEDRHMRLVYGRAMLVNLSKRLKQAAQAEQFFRIQRDGKDIGWSYVTEEFGQRQGEQGLFVAVLSQVTPEAGVKIDTSSEMFCPDSRRSESWMTITTIEKDGNKTQTSEFGQAERHVTRKLVGRENVDKTDRNPLVDETRLDRLTVTQTTLDKVVPTQRDLPPSYMQQALSSMLPRLLVLNEPKGYVFTVWVGGERELVLRYLDVEPRKTVTFAGLKTTAIPVKDRIGLDGDPTYHYITPEGKYLGSVSSAGVSIIATDAQTLAGLYPNANPVRPRLLDAPAER